MDKPEDKFRITKQSEGKTINLDKSKIMITEQPEDVTNLEGKLRITKQSECRQAITKQIRETP